MEEAKNDINIMKSLILRPSHMSHVASYMTNIQHTSLADGEKLSDRGALHAYS